MGGEIQRLRTKAGHTLRGFAQLVEVSAAYLSDIERDRRRPSPEVLERIVKQLKAVGATPEAFDELNTRLEPDLRRWMADTPGARQLLREVYESRRDPREILRQLEKQVRKKDGNK